MGRDCFNRVCMIERKFLYAAEAVNKVVYKHVSLNGNHHELTAKKSSRDRFG